MREGTAVERMVFRRGWGWGGGSTHLGSSGEAEASESLEFEASWIYTASSRLAKATCWNPVSKNGILV